MCFDDLSLLLLSKSLSFLKNILAFLENVKSGSAKHIIVQWKENQDLTTFQDTELHDKKENGNSLSQNGTKRVHLSPF